MCVDAHLTEDSLHYPSQHCQYERNVRDPGRLVELRQVPGRNEAYAEISDQRAAVRDPDPPTDRVDGVAARSRERRRSWRRAGGT